MKEIALSVSGEGSTGESLFSDIDVLVSEGKLIEVEYCLPNTDRLKSFLLPAGTEVKVR